MTEAAGAGSVSGAASASVSAAPFVSGDRPVVLLTGATGGIGRVVAVELARDRDVLALGRDGARLDALRAIDGVIPVEIELTDFDALARLVGALPRLDVLIHCAATATQHSVESASVDDWRTQLDLNVVVPAELTRLGLPLLRKSRGQVVFINSGAGLTGLPGNVVYSASKFALRALADAVRREEEHDGVRVSSVHPGPTSKGGEREADDPRARPESVARAIRLVVDASDDTQITTVYVRPRVELGTS